MHTFAKSKNLYFGCRRGDSFCMEQMYDKHLYVSASAVGSNIWSGFPPQKLWARREVQI
jgi:hypothetical protein